MCPTEPFQQWMQLLCAEVGVREAQPLQLFEDAGVPETGAAFLGRTAAWIEPFEFPVHVERRLPTVQRAQGEVVCLDGGIGAVSSPEREYLCPPLCFWGDHIPEAYRPVVHLHPPLSALQVAVYSHAPWCSRSAIC